MRKQRWMCYLIFDASGVKRMTLGRPNLRAGDYAIALRLKIPSSVFARALPEATIEVPAPAVLTPEVVVENDVATL
jgi:hypothetical protein